MWCLSPASGCIPTAAADVHAGRAVCRLAPVGRLARTGRERSAVVSAKLGWRSGETQAGCPLLQRAPSKRHRPATTVRRLTLLGRAWELGTDT